MSEKRLWARVNGEPFMVNPALGILNPRKRGKKMAARRRRRSTVRRVRSYRRRRRNPFPVAGVALNPRRRRRHRRHSFMGNRRRRRLSNPRSFSLAGFSLPPLQAVIYAGTGFVGMGAIDYYVSPYLPVGTDGTVSPIYKWALRIGGVIGLTFLAKAVFGKEKAKTVAVGASVFVVMKAAKELLPAASFPFLASLSAYRPMSAYRQLAAPQKGFLAAPITNQGNMNQTIGATPQRFRRF